VKIRLCAWLVSTIFVLGSFASANATETRNCIIQALQQLQSSPGRLVSQNDTKLSQRGLIEPGAESTLCGVTCATHLMQAVRKAYGKNSIYASSVDEIEELSKVGRFFGENVSRHGMSLFSLKAAIGGDLLQHRIQGRVIGITLEADAAKGDVTLVREISKSDFSGSAGTHSAVIALMHDTRRPRGSTGHYILVQNVDFPGRTFRFLDPQFPDRTQQGFIVPENRGRQSTFILSNGSPDGAGWRIDGLIRVEIQP